MQQNRSIPQCTVIPELAYEDVNAAADWLCRAFGFTRRVTIGGHRVQLNVADGALIVKQGARVESSDSIMIRIADAHMHHARSAESGARILRIPADQPFGERQYTAIDPWGHQWTFSQTIADIAPTAWGGQVGVL